MRTAGRPLVSVIIPAYNEVACIEELSQRLIAMAAGVSARYDFEFIVIENGSIDGTFPALIAAREADTRFKIIRLTRNFGIEGALTAGLQYAKGDAAILMCADLQDPPELVPQFLAAWEEGYQNVYGIVIRRTDESHLRRALTGCFYWLVNRLNQHPVPKNASDFRLVDRSLYTVLNSMSERNRMLRTMWAWLGYKSTGIRYDRPERYAGRSTYRLFANIWFGLHGLASSTTTPLRLIPYVGLMLSGLSFVIFCILLARWLTKGVPFSGFGTIVTLFLLLFSVLFLLLGVLSEYIGIIYEEVRRRPMFVVESLVGLVTPDASSSPLRDQLSP